MKFWFKQARVKFLEWRYALHIRARYMHDTTYQKGGRYKGWTDKLYSGQVHELISYFDRQQSLIYGKI